MKLSILLLSTSLWACATSPNADLDPGKSDTQRSAHGRAIDACTDRFGDDAEAYFPCLVDANRAAVPAIAELVDRELDIAGAVEGSTSAADRFCELMQALQDPRDPDTAQLERESCLARRNYDVGLLMDLHVGWDGARPSFDPPGSRFPACYEAFDAAIGDATSTAAMIEVHGELAACVEAELRRGLEDSIVEGLQTDGTSVDAARVRFAADLDAVVASITTACTVFAAASGEEDGSLERVEQASCVSDGIGMLGLESRSQLESDL